MKYYYTKNEQNQIDQLHFKWGNVNSDFKMPVEIMVVEVLTNIHPTTEENTIPLNQGTRFELKSFKGSYYSILETKE